MPTFEAHSPLLRPPAPPGSAARPASERARRATPEPARGGRLGRIAAIDAARGVAMLLVCASHIKHHFIETAPAIHWLLLSITRMATPTFLLLSGFVIGHLLRSSARGNVGVTLIDRGLFLLLVAHLLMGIPQLPQTESGMAWMFARVEITDVIAISLFIAVAVRALSWPVLLTAGVALCVLSWPVAMLFEPQTEPLKTLSAVLFHTPSEHAASIEAPVVAYAGVFLIGMALSGRHAAGLAAHAVERVAPSLLKLAVASFAVVALGILAWHFLKDALPAAARSPELEVLLRGTLDPRSKWPPSPAYLVFYGGAGLLLTGLMLRGRPTALFAPLVRRASVIGRASLMCFVLQNWLFFGLPVWLGFDHFTSVPFWFAYLAASVAILYGLSRKWDEARGNRFLTVGLKWMHARSMRTAKV